MLTFARELQHDALDQFHNGLHNIFMSVTSEYNCAIFCLDGHPPKFVYPATRCKVRMLSTIRGARSVGGQCRIIVSDPFWLKSVVKISVFAVGFGTCPWCSSLRAVLLLPWWRVPVVSARPQLDSGVGAQVSHVDELPGEAVSGEGGGARSPSSRTAGATEWSSCPNACLA